MQCMKFIKLAWQMFSFFNFWTTCWLKNLLIPRWIFLKDFKLDLKQLIYSFYEVLNQTIYVLNKNTSKIKVSVFTIII